MDANKTITISTELFWCLCEAETAMKILKKHQSTSGYDKNARIEVLDAVLAAYGTEEKEEETC